MYGQFVLFASGLMSLFLQVEHGYDQADVADETGDERGLVRGLFA